MTFSMVRFAHRMKIPAANNRTGRNRRRNRFRAGVRRAERGSVHPDIEYEPDERIRRTGREDADRRRGEFVSFLIISPGGTVAKSNRLGERVS